MTRLKFFKYLQLLLGLSLLFCSVLPLDVIVFNAHLAEQLKQTKMCDVTYIRDTRTTATCDHGNEDDDAEDKETAEDSWEDYDFACQCPEIDCSCKLQAIQNLNELERSLSKTSNEEDVFNPFGFDQIAEGTLNKTGESIRDTDYSSTPVVSGVSKETQKENRAPQPSKKRKLLLTISVVQNDLRTVRCCQQNCLQCVPLETAVDCRTMFWAVKSQAEQRNFMMTSIRHATTDKNGRRFFKIVNCKQNVCRKAWCTVYGIKDTRYKDTLKLVKEGTFSVDGKRCCFPSMPYETAKRWFRKFVFMSDVMPTTGFKHLPSCLSKRSIYMLYKEDMAKENKTTISETHFIHKMWKKEFPNVIIPKQCRFTKCTICVHLKAQLLNSKLNKSQRIKLTNMRKVHLIQQMAERRNYYLHGIKAKQEPTKYLSFIMDGMDQNKTRLPHFTEKTKVDDGLWKLKTHITGVLVDSRSRCYAYVDVCEYPHDPNLTIHLILNVLVKEQEKRGQLPPVLYIQMDNCGRENKNTAVIAFLALLVKLDIFKKVRLGFLMVGHTHEDIDQMFSCVSRKLQKSNAVTLEDLSQKMREAYNPCPEIEVLKYLPDVKTWMEPHIGKLVGHSEPHQFKLEKDGSGSVHMKYRKWSTSQTWLPNTEAGEKNIVLFESNPTGVPAHVPVDLDNTITCLERDMPKYGFTFNPDQQQWWKNFLDELKLRQTGKAPQGIWMLKQLKRCTSKPNVAAPVSLLDEEDELVHEELEKRFNKERRNAKVTLKKKGKTAGQKRKNNKKSSGKSKKKRST